MRVLVPCIVVGVIASLLCPRLAAAQTDTSADAPGNPPAEAGAPRDDDALERRRLSDAGELQRIISLYDGGKYEECVREVVNLLDPQNNERLTNPKVVTEARLYHATCLVMSGRENEAIAPLRAVLLENPTLGTPDSLTFPPPLISLFLEVRKEFADAIRAEEERKLKELKRAAEAAQAEERAERRRVVALENLARTESVVRVNSRMVASLPFGIGQFQNDDDTLGAVFLVTESLLLGTSIAAVGVVLDQYSHYGPNVFNTDIQHNVERARTVSLVAFYGFVGVAGVGIAEANINFVPRFRYERRRELPEELERPKRKDTTRSAEGAWLPWLTPTQGGVSAGVVGTF